MVSTQIFVIVIPIAVLKRIIIIHAIAIAIVQVIADVTGLLDCRMYGVCKCQAPSFIHKLQYFIFDNYERRSAKSFQIS